MPTPSFTAIDFETADAHPNTACAVALVQVRNGVVVRRGSTLIAPPGGTGFRFSSLHGITQEMTMLAPSHEVIGLWLSQWSEGTPFFAAHNAEFDRAAFLRMCVDDRIRRVPWLCTVELARAAWGIFPTSLPAVCTRLNLELVHHDPLSDALACAGIVVRAAAELPRIELSSFFIRE